MQMAARPNASRPVLRTKADLNDPSFCGRERMLSKGRTKAVIGLLAFIASKPSGVCSCDDAELIESNVKTDSEISFICSGDLSEENDG